MRDPYKIVNHGKEAMDLAIALQGEIANPRPKLLNKFGWVYKTKDGKLKTVNRGNQPCYADLLYNWKPIGAKALYFVDWANSLYDPKDGISEKKALEYVKWAATQSVWRRAFVTKNPEQLISGPSIFNTAHPIRFVVQAAMMLRYIYEKQPIIAMWFRLKEYVDKHAAFYLAHQVAPQYDHANIYVRLGNDGHNMFDKDRDNAIVLHSLVTRDFSFMKKMHSTYKKAYGYRNLESIWGPKEYVPLTLPPYTVEKITGTWGRVIKGWEDLGKFAKETVRLNMEEAVERLAKLDKKTIDRDRQMEDEGAPPGPEAAVDYDDDNDVYIEEDDI